MASHSRVVLLALFLVACGDGMSPTDGGGLDAATGADSGSADAGAPTDAGSTDSGSTDAGAPTDSGVDCSTAVVDEPCTTDGAFCGGPCTDQCSFCNILSCSGGTWNRVEVFPAPCFDCGESVRCVTGEQHCVHSFSDVGGEPDSFECADNPAACGGAMATCMCLDDTLTFDRCLEPNPGEVEIQFFGG